MIASRLPFLISVVVFAGLAAESRASVPSSDELGARPNVLFIVSDDLNTDLGCYGHPAVQSPHIDRLAKQGVQFERAYCQGVTCNPSRTSFMTGLYPTQTKVQGNYAPHFRKRIPNVTTLPQHFEEAGYITARVSKLFHAGVPSDIGTPGHDDPLSWQERINPRGLDRNVHDRFHKLDLGSFGGPHNWLAIESEDREHTDGITATCAVQMMDRYADDPRPFFLAVGFYRPHPPYVAPSRYFEQYPRSEIELANVPEDDWADLPQAAVGSITWGGRKRQQSELPPETQRTVLQAYYASVSFMDAQVGRLVNAVDELGLSDNTVVVFTSDHGFHLGEHHWWRKGTLFEESARVPLIVAGPGMEQQGEVTKAVAELVDLYPTLADLAGLDIPPWLPGKSLRPALQDTSASVRKAALTQAGRGFSIRTPQWRYTEWKGSKEAAELYDHQADPQEHTNLAGDKAHKQTVERLSRLLNRRIQDAKTTPEAVQ